MMRVWLAMVIIALVAGPADAQSERRSKRQRRSRSSKPVKPEVTTPAPEPEALRQPAAKVEPAKPTAKAADPTKPGDAARRESRIEFDERMVQGQTAAGAIYLFQRADAAFSSMIAAPGSFRERTLHTVYVDGVPGAAGASP